MLICRMLSNNNLVTCWSVEGCRTATLWHVYLLKVKRTTTLWYVVLLNVERTTTLWYVDLSKVVEHSEQQAYDMLICRKLRETKTLLDVVLFKVKRTCWSVKDCSVVSSTHFNIHFLQHFCPILQQNNFAILRNSEVLGTDDVASPPPYRHLPTPMRTCTCTSTCMQNRQTMIWYASREPSSLNVSIFVKKTVLFFSILQCRKLHNPDCLVLHASKPIPTKHARG